MFIPRIMLAGAAAGLALAAGTGQLEAQNGQEDFRADSAFINQVAAGNLAEVRLGQMAEKKAQHDAVKQFGARMVKDHTAKQRDWMMAARLYKYPFNARLTPEQEATMTRLDALSGDAFDRAYMDQMVQDHYNNLNAYQAAHRGARSVSVRRMAEQGIPGIQEHYNLALQVRSQVNPEAVAAADPNAPAQGQPGAQPTTPWGDVKPEVKPSPSGRVPSQTQPQAGTVTPASNNTAKMRADWKADSKFWVNALQFNLLQQRLGERAQEKAQDDDVKRFGERMAKDFAEMHELWLAAARRNGVNASPVLGPKHMDKVQKVEKKSGRSFDREYMTLMVQEHKEYLDYFQREGRKAHSEDVRAVVNRQIPMLWDHFNLAKRVGAEVGAKTDVEPRATSSR